MPAPKTVVKLRKQHGNSYVEYTSNVDACEYYIFELSRAALRDVAKFVKRKFREAYYSHFQRHTGNAGRVTQYTVHSGKREPVPNVDIGLKVGKSKGQENPGFYGYFQEIGTKKTPRLALLTKTVESNVATIIEIESKYLSGLADEAAALRLIESEDDYEEDLRSDE